MGKSICVALVTHDVARRERWSQMLQDADGSFCLLAFSSETLADQLPDLIVTDTLPLQQIDSRWTRRLVQGGIGLLVVGSSGPADVALPADHSARELRLASRLLAQVVQLRRKQRRDLQICRKLRLQAMTDSLTGLLNRRGWNARLTELRDDQPADRSSNQIHGLVLVDLDHFKRVNDRFGYAAGDRVLRVVARALKSGLSPRDSLARLGGDEFVLLLCDVEPDSMESLAESIRCRACLDVDTDSGVLSVTATAGHAVIDSVTDSGFARAMRDADIQLRHAKRRIAGRTSSSAQ